MTGPLTKGQWEALIYIVPDRARHLVLKLAIYHGLIERPIPENCPICGKEAEEPPQGGLFVNQK